MNKLVSLLKAVMSQDMKLFRTKARAGSKVSRMVLPVVLAFLLMSAMGMYAMDLAEALEPSGLTYVMLLIFIIFTSLLALVEAIYKSQGILFEAKDNDLLLSLPISRAKIVLVRLLKLVSFQTLYSALFLVPAILVYAKCVHPGPEFYAVGILMLILVPILPTIVGSVVGYLISFLVSKTKARNLVQVVLTCLMLAGVLYVSFDTRGVATSIVENADGINKALAGVYYPAKLYVELVVNFNWLDLAILLVINLVPAALFVCAGSVYYFKIISKLSEKGRGKVKDVHEATRKLKVKSPLVALMHKELKRFFASPVLMVNAGFGLLLMVVVTGCMAFNFDGIVGSVAGGTELNLTPEDIKTLMPKLFYCLVVCVGCTTSISSSMISLEGKSFNVTKSLPVSSAKVLLAKVLASDLITVPVILICDVMFFVAFGAELPEAVFILLASVMVPTFTALLGLLVNLKYPKMEATSDTEVVKQSMSSMVSVFIGLLVTGVAVLGVMAGNGENSELCIMGELLGFGVAILGLWVALLKYGTRRFREIEG